MVNQHNKFTCTATTMAGLEDVLAEELHQIGATDIEKVTRAVSFTADNKIMYKANLWLRTSLRVLKPIHKFIAENEEQLYQGVKQIDWAEYLDIDGTLAVESAVNSPFFNHSQYVALKTKDAVVDQFRNRYGKRPNVSIDAPSIKIHVHIFNNQCTLSLDSSSESLHRRGYRLEQNAAPLNEVLAAGLLLIADWKGNSHFIDPMCGSGTIVIEAGLIAKNIAPGLMRRHFGFMGWKDFDDELWQSLVDEAYNAQRECEYDLIGSDISPQAVDIARANVTRAGLDEDIRIVRRAFEDQDPPKGGGMMVMNPPYGERLELEDDKEFYKRIGDVLKRKYGGYQAWVLSSNKDALKFIGLRPSKKHLLYNGPLECRYHQFNVFEGSMKDKWEASK